VTVAAMKQRCMSRYQKTSKKKEEMCEMHNTLQV